MNITSRRAVVPGIAALVLALSACGSGSSSTDEVSGDVAVDGSSTVFPMSDTAAEYLMEASPGVDVSVGFSGTGGGFEKFCAGQTDVSNASRPIKDEEIALCGDNGVDFTELKVATDALTIVVHPDLAVDCLTTTQVEDLFGPEATAKKWSDLDTSFPDTKIAGFIPGADSGTYDYMASDVIGHDTESLRTDFEVNEDDNVLVQGVSGTQGGVGFFGYTYFEENADKLKALSIDSGNGCVAPSAETAQAGEYTPLARDLFIYVNDAKYADNAATQAYVDHYVENLAEIAETAQYIPLNDAEYAETQEKLAGIAG
ncbi:PstS family phosphate ABC transporter substrate-binding protein [Nocardioides yefusunii]|uniref:Phosphate-binding protein n=1 Tax=Nocardioides yefusunii TaxID=2500546 RepID=A0ABW1QUG3_9ACTN|nr:PstS family phosphate ABC transporter substrate-binding protein [Nocardioides yefusunii]